MPQGVEPESLPWEEAFATEEDKPSVRRSGPGRLRLWRGSTAVLPIGERGSCDALPDDNSRLIFPEQRHKSPPVLYGICALSRLALPLHPHGLHCLLLHSTDEAMSNSRSQGRGTRPAQDLSLPPIPRALPKMLHHLHAAEFADKEHILAAVQCSSGLGERVLNRINSQLPRPVSGLEQAIEMVGATTAAGIVIKLSMNKLNVLRRGPAGSCIRQLIQHSEATAVLARHLLRRRRPDSAAQTSDPEDVDLAQTAFAKGFVHDLGKLVLIYNDPEKGAALYGDDWIERDPEGASDRAVERRAFGHDHTEAGAYAAAEIGLPAGLVAVARDHHGANATPEDPSDAWGLRAVQAANLVTKAMESSFSGLYAQDVSLDWETCARHPAWLHWETASSADPETLAQEDFILYSEFFLDRTGSGRLLS